MSRKKLEGVLCLAPLPLLKNQEIDYEAVKSNIRLLAKNKVHGFIAFGSTGQHNAPSEEEFNKVVDASMEAASANQVCVIGTTAPTTREAIRRTKYAEDAGADGCMQAVPYAFPLTEDWVVDHYTAVNNAIKGDISIMVYNSPSGYRFNITPEMWERRMLKLEHITAVKESIEEEVQRNRLLLMVGDRINVFSGMEEQFWNDSMLGAKGITALTTWAAPAVLLRYYEECRKGNHFSPWMRSFYRKLMVPALRGIDPTMSPYMYGIGILAALVEAGGGKAGPARTPYGLLPEKERARLLEYVQRLRATPLP